MRNIIYLLSAFLFISCGLQPTKQLESISDGQYKETSYEKIPNWQEENFSQAFILFKKTCKNIATNELYKVACSNAQKQQNPREFFEKNFTPFITLSRNSIASGYYEPVLYGSLIKNQDYIYPVYGVPDDMYKIDILNEYKKEFSKELRGRIVDDKIKSYFSRKEIENGAIKTKPICYVNDKIELYFLQEIGHGTIKLKNNKYIHLEYTDFNGYKNLSIEEYMIENNILKEKKYKVIKKINPADMRKYLRNNPSLQDEIFQNNQSYVFFEKQLQGPTGSLGMLLEEKRSIAVDKGSIPLGMPVFVSATDSLGNKIIDKIMFAHDSHKSLKGETKISVFFGSGKKARRESENMSEKVRFWVLVPNDYLHHNYILKSKYIRK